MGRRQLGEQLEMHGLLVDDQGRAGEGVASSRTSRPIPGDGYDSVFAPAAAWSQRAASSVVIGGASLSPISMASSA
jgi:hypothetical protein